QSRDGDRRLTAALSAAFRVGLPRHARSNCIQGPMPAPPARVGALAYRRRTQAERGVVMAPNVDVSLGSWFARRAAATPDRPALSFEGTTRTYAQFLDRVDRLAAGLRAGGVCHGDRVGFLGLNQPAFFEPMFAASRLGANFVPLNFRLTAPALAFIIGDAGTLVVAPLFHIGGLNVTTLVTWQKGGEVVLHRSFDPGACLEAISRHGVTTMFGVPAMLLFMSQHPEFGEADLTSLRMMVCGGAPVPEALIKIYNGVGIPINQGYG